MENKNYISWHTGEIKQFALPWIYLAQFHVCKSTSKHVCHLFV